MTLDARGGKPDYNLCRAARGHRRPGDPGRELGAYDAPRGGPDVLAVLDDRDPRSEVVLREDRCCSLERRPADQRVELPTAEISSLPEVHDDQVRPVTERDPTDRGSEPSRRPVARGRQEGGEIDLSPSCLLEEERQHRLDPWSPAGRRVERELLGRGRVRGMIAREARDPSRRELVPQTGSYGVGTER